MKNKTDTGSVNQERIFDVGVICPGDDTPGMPVRARLVIDLALADRIRLLSEEVRRLDLFFIAQAFDQMQNYAFANDEMFTGPGAKPRLFTCDSVTLNVYKDTFCLHGYESHSGVQFETKEIRVSDLDGLTAGLLAPSLTSTRAADRSRSKDRSQKP
ncbi:MAG: hypothetical protein ACYDDA_09880 [Acidiferrobacteraceae bacterium]